MPKHETLHYLYCLLSNITHFNYMLTDLIFCSLDVPGSDNSALSELLGAC